MTYLGFVVFMIGFFFTLFGMGMTGTHISGRAAVVCFIYPVLLVFVGTVLILGGMFLLCGVF